MKLHQLVKKGGSHQKRKRVARGPGSGTGKTAGRGSNGSKSRSGYAVRPGFEGGQMPLYRKLPIRGFNNARFAKEYAIINLSDLERVDGTEVNKETLILAGILRNSDKMFKILGVGEVKKAFTVSAHRFSQSAKEKIEAAGGKVVILGNSEEAAA